MANKCRLLPIGDSLAVETPYNAEFVSWIKALPLESRRWDGANRRWVVLATMGEKVQSAIHAFYGETVEVPQAVVSSAPTVRVLSVEYVGRCKPRGSGEPSATGFSGGGWSVVFPESVLRAWFLSDPEEPGETPSKPRSLYQVLAVKPEATPEEIKQAYRRLARQWHPDVCKEPDAKERFQRLGEAYATLSDPTLRKKYDVGRKLQANAEMHSRTRSTVKNMARDRHDADVYGYRAPLRCGMIVAEGVERLGSFVVGKVLAWEDIRNADGKTMISSWPQGADHFVVTWY